jgi:transcriptional regulator with XRE-family HTH domain
MADVASAAARMEAQSELGQLLRRLRNSTGINRDSLRQELSDDHGLHTRTSSAQISRIELGQSAPTVQFVEAMLKITGASRQDADRARELLEDIYPTRVRQANSSRTATTPFAHPG